MTYAFSYEVPASIEMYREVKRLVGDEPVSGMLAHLVTRSESGLRHVEVWESEAACHQFRRVRLAPAVRSVLTAAGFTEMPPEPVLEELDLVDIQV
jgi:hypothetical protein